MKKDQGKFVALIVAILSMWVLITLFLNSSFLKTGGKLVYSHDDAYIHMTMAKNFSQHGVWGVTKYKFSSSSSSLLWTLLLSFSYSIFGKNELTPFVLNFFFSTVLLLFLYYSFEKFNFYFFQTLFVLICFIIFIPLPHLIFSGLEHILQMLIDLVFIYIASIAISSNVTLKDKIGRKHTYLFLLAPLVTMVRFEGVFLVFAVCILLLFKREFIKSFILGITGILPVLIYGIVSVSKGWYFLPNSVLLKGNRLKDLLNFEGFLNFFYIGIRHIVYNIHILLFIIIILCILLFLLKKQKSLFSFYPVMCVIFLITTFIHMVFARTGFFLNRPEQVRYDSYLVAIGLFVIFNFFGYILREKILVQKGKFLERLILIFLVFICILPLAERGIRMSVRAPQATFNVYSQQYQMGLFLDKYYKGEHVIVNDIGATNFLADIKCLDILGLCNKDIGGLILKERYTKENIVKWAYENNARIAIIYDDLLRPIGGVPQKWIKVGEWTILKNVICAFNTVSFYAINIKDVPDLIRNIRKFSAQLPKGAICRIASLNYKRKH